MIDSCASPSVTKNYCDSSSLLIHYYCDQPLMVPISRLLIDHWSIVPRVTTHWSLWSPQFYRWFVTLLRYWLTNQEPCLITSTNYHSPFLTRIATLSTIVIMINRWLTSSSDWLLLASLRQFQLLLTPWWPQVGPSGLRQKPALATFGHGSVGGARRGGGDDGPWGRWERKQWSVMMDDSDD